MNLIFTNFWLTLKRGKSRSNKTEKGCLPIFPSVTFSSDSVQVPWYRVFEIVPSKVQGKHRSQSQAKSANGETCFSDLREREIQIVDF
jgi:hypothetical protein